MRTAITWVCLGLVLCAGWTLIASAFQRGLAYEPPRPLVRTGPFVAQVATQPTKAPTPGAATALDAGVQTIVPPTGNLTNPQAAKNTQQTQPLEPTPEERILATLREPTEFDLKDATIEQIATYVAERHKLNVFVDHKALNDENFDISTKFNFRAKNLQLREALRLVLDHHDLSYLIQEAALVLTTKNEAINHLLIRVHYVGDILTPDENGECDVLGLIEVVSSTVQQDSWKESGGQGCMAGFGQSRLVVSNTNEVHEKIEDLLARIRRDIHLHPDPPASKPSPNGPSRPKQSSTSKIEELLGLKPDKPAVQMAALPLTNAHKQAARAINQFGIDFHHRQAAAQPDENYFCSPLSIATVLGMSALGAKEKTLAETCRVLHWEENGQPRPYHAETGELLADLLRANQTEDVKITNQQALWVQKGLPLQDSFTTILKRDYQSTPRILDFALETNAARQGLGDWGREQGFAELPGFGEAITADTRFFLANAINFKGRWQHEFDKDSTKYKPFYLANGQAMRTNYLIQKEEFEYAKTDECKLLRLPYRQTRFGCVYLLPKNRDGLPALEKSLTEQKLRELLAQLKPVSLDVEVPKFKMSWQGNLIKDLKALGMSAPFDQEQADYSGMTPRPPEGLWVQSIMHQAEVEFDEEGTTAKAVTVMGYAGAIVEEPPSFRAYHPFLFLIMDQHSGLILFMGRFTDPAKAVGSQDALNGVELSPPPANPPPERPRQSGGIF
ncbi:MAG: serpin family protein [Pirellulales bacterium]|nr:serpin family protein [Pirellulales bacterium]